MQTIDESIADIQRQMVYQDTPPSRAFLIEFTDDMPPFTDKHLQIMVETAYRRGFTQGVASCARAMIAGQASHITGWLYRLMHWRRKRHGGKVVFPEEIA